MSKLILSVNLQAYDDSRPSNAPSRSPIKWSRDLQSIVVNNPKSEDYTIAPGSTQSLFSGMRILNQDGTTEYSLALAPLSTTTYQLSWAGGTAPNFRTPRSIGIDATTQVTTSVNATVETFTFTSTFSTYAFFTGTIPGMSTPVTITATNIGTIGNSVVLDADGTSSINTLITNWNTANPSNTIALTTGDGTQIPLVGIAATYSGTPTGTTLPITLTAANIGAGGNSILLTGNGAADIATLIANWNTANPGNQVTQTAGISTQVPAVGALMQLSGGVEPETITLSGGTNAQPLNLVTSGVVVGDFVTIGSNFNVANRGTFQIISLTPISFSVINANAVVEGPITLGSGYATQVQMFSAAGVQAGDTLVISSGFSPVSWGSYQITSVQAESLQFSSTAVLPSESSIMTEVAIYSMAKSLIYMESSGPLAITINGSATPIILQPFQLTDCCVNGFSGPGTNAPGMLLLTSTVYSLSVTNSGSDPVQLFLAAVE
jgi:hypothetical protein